MKLADSASSSWRCVGLCSCQRSDSAVEKNSDFRRRVAAESLNEGE